MSALTPWLRICRTCPACSLHYLCCRTPMAPKAVAQTFYAANWTRCNICGLLVRDCTVHRGEPDVDHVYARTTNPLAHDRNQIPTMCDIVRLESEMDLYEAHLRKKPATWNPNVLPRACTPPQTANSSSTPTEVLAKSAKNIIRKKPAAVMRKPAAVTRKPAAAVNRKPAAAKRR